MQWARRHLAEREFLLDRFGVADAYLVTVLGWSVATPIELGKWPALGRYVDRMRERPGPSALRRARALHRTARAARELSRGPPADWKWVKTLEGGAGTTVVWPRF